MILFCCVELELWLQVVGKDGYIAILAIVCGRVKNNECIRRKRSENSCKIQTSMREINFYSICRYLHHHALADILPTKDDKKGVRGEKRT